jgi:hypothetical protein
VNKSETEPKEFRLVKTNYVYDPSAGIYPEASSRELSVSDVENRLAEELTVMRNEIYARHGYSFNNKAVRARFDSTGWYVPMGLDIREKLTEVEVQNIALITRYESYYEEAYDEYGR